MAREAKKDFQGPFLGFTYNGRHSSELGIVRINTGNRAEMPLSPSFKDSTAEVPGGKGLYYFNTQIQQRQFTINFAYDDLTEEDVRELREWLNPLEQGELIFDEEPYKAYTVKPNTQPKLSYLVFNKEITTETFKLYEPSTVKSSGRVYKGEGAIGLTAYYPYAKAPYKTIEDYSVYKDIEKKEFSHYRGYGHPDEWAIASGMDKKPSLDFEIINNKYVRNKNVVCFRTQDMWYFDSLNFTPYLGEILVRSPISVDKIDAYIEENMLTYKNVEDEVVDKKVYITEENYYNVPLVNINVIDYYALQSDDLKEIIKECKETLEDIRKEVGRNATRTSAKVVSKLTRRKVLGLDEE